jgi:hypothetical protein
MPKIVELIAVLPETDADGLMQEVMPDDELGVNYPGRNLVLPKTFVVDPSKPYAYKHSAAAIAAAQAEQNFYAERIQDVRLVVLVNGEPLIRIHESLKPMPKKKADRLVRMERALLENVDYADQFAENDGEIDESEE